MGKLLGGGGGFDKVYCVNSQCKFWKHVQFLNWFEPIVIGIYWTFLFTVSNSISVGHSTYSAIEFNLNKYLMFHVSVQNKKYGRGLKGIAQSQWWRRQYHLFSIGAMTLHEHVYLPSYCLCVYLQPMVVKFQEVMNKHLRKYLEKLTQELEEKVCRSSAFPGLCSKPLAWSPVH